ncbi:L-alanine exporter AlaE [Candidatus Woesearchaeota archaeon]|nr:L-alanine exporter AlaE [Candidatus Woesearchaeota archaeon]
MHDYKLTDDHLELKIEKIYEPVRDIKAYLVDTTARIIFYVPIVGVCEYISGMEDYKILKSRIAAIPINFFLGRMHGKARELAGRITKTDENSSKKRKFVVDTTTGLVVGLAPYAFILKFIAKANLEQALIAMPLVTGVALFSGRPYGKFLDWYREKFRTTPVYEEENPTHKPL